MRKKARLRKTEKKKQSEKRKSEREWEEEERKEKNIACYWKSSRNLCAEFCLLNQRTANVNTIIIFSLMVAKICFSIGKSAINNLRIDNLSIKAYERANKQTHRKCFNRMLREMLTLNLYYCKMIFLLPFLALSLITHQ